MADPIVDSWKANAQAWISTIEGAELESRKLVTNKAIVDIVLKYRPGKVLDIGCGEGWLCRALQRSGIETLGVDAVADFIRYAQSKGEGLFEQATYHDLIRQKTLPLAPFDAIVINFALLDKDTTEQLLATLPKYLTSRGRLFIQTLHPYVVGGNQPYQSGWQSEEWQLMPRDFSQPYRWYYRTLEDWITLFLRLGYQLAELREPIHPKNQRPVSVIFVLQRS